MKISRSLINLLLLGCSTLMLSAKAAESCPIDKAHCAELQSE